MEFNITHVDTCLPCYVLDHCNGDNEQLFGVMVDGTTRIYHIREYLNNEILIAGDKLPEWITETMINEAIDELTKGVHHLSKFDKSLEVSDYEMGESCYAWFRATWESE